MKEKWLHIIQKISSSGSLRISLHVLFWLTVGYFYYFIFILNSDFPKVSLIFTIGLLPVAILETYIFNYLLIPKFLSNRKYGKFFYLSLFTVLVSTWLSFLIVFYALINILNTEASLEPATLHPELQVISLNFIVFFAIAVKQVKRAFFMQQEKNELEKAQLTTQLKLKEAELKLLKAQVHPHFLFNTLNNLYGLTLEKSDEAPKLVLQLSEILDYILYRCDAPKVLLKEDLNNLKNYIDIEKIRYSHKLKMTVEFPKHTGKLQIAPLILLPYVENAFKHGVSHFPGTAFVKISLSVSGKNLNFHIENTRNPLVKNGNNTSGGIGMANAKRRLDLLYAGNYILEVDKKDETFSVNLTLKLEE
ncbi:sensor histidine kinase [Maribellus sediminis]|uniref:sensor histidine kinase n=1 Tax=Maribellus sediminis TaxID=2696285 RepID=UPI001430F50A|nr:histidine kinase [Maribellus sediminis]